MKNPTDSTTVVTSIARPVLCSVSNTAFFGSINIITNDIKEKNSGQISASYGFENTQKLFARFGSVYDHGNFLLNAGWYRTDGITADYPEEVLTDPRMKKTMDQLGQKDRAAIVLIITRRTNDILHGLSAFKICVQPENSGEGYPVFFALLNQLTQYRLRCSREYLQKSAHRSTLKRRHGREY